MFSEMVAKMDEVTYLRLRDAAETGKWPDGTALTEEQRGNCLQLVMAYQSLRQEEHQHMEIGPGGELVQKSKRELKAEFNGSNEQEIMRTKL
ncbi:YeaC family protein [Gallaecimonas xiamenensis]|uniref:DUF1315 family protein n=1 Tax=Gallaecimonas xiamenensis 3-C-1 TaxID=745411 RepID=K2JRB4_9GAMM|nr:DUF1315 family protein [Gallaecimonas xiamenensis]EKE77928.1 hypothetical protein B3C1_00670 [Gallaecimonas xiamenensis 3-C-1]